jgi:hypothetical protein
MPNFSNLSDLNKTKEQCVVRQHSSRALCLHALLLAAHFGTDEGPPGAFKSSMLAVHLHSAP